MRATKYALTLCMTFLAVGASSRTSRRVLLGAPFLAASLPSAGRAADSRGFVLAPVERGGLQSRWLEQLRVVLQDSADAAMYGGELAPGGPPTAPALLLLVPLVQVSSYGGRAWPYPSLHAGMVGACTGHSLAPEIQFVCVGRVGIGPAVPRHPTRPDPERAAPLQLETTLESIRPLLRDASRWPAVVALLSTGYSYIMI
jgi:hypothetical protein